MRKLIKGTVGGQHLVRSERGPWLRLLLLAFFFFLGLVLGQVLSGRVDASTSGELSDYLNGYFSLENRPDLSAGTVLSAIVIYFRYPLLAFFLGFASVGVALLPVVTAAYGFFLSFSVCCFTAAFGREGVLLALAVFGLRCLLTLPCYFALAAPAMEKASALAALSLGQRRASAPVYGRDWWLRFALAAAILAGGVLLELAVVPRLLEWVLRGIFSAA